MAKKVANYGSQWTDDDNIRLFSLLKEGKSYDEISEDMERTVRAVELRVEKSMYYYYTKKNHSVNDLHDLTGLDKNDITIMIAKNSFADAAKASNKNTEKEKSKNSHLEKNNGLEDKDLLTVLLEINEKLTVIADKLSSK